MRFIIGFLMVPAMVFGGYAAAGGHLNVLWQPFEVIIIFGAAVGAFIHGNPGFVLKGAAGMFGKLVKGSPYKKKDFLEVLCMLFEFFKVARTEGLLKIEAHIENPKESNLFQKYPAIMKNTQALNFFCDYMRILTMGVDNHGQVASLMAEELSSDHNRNAAISSAICTMGDGMPALGIVAAVLGVIHTMGSITEPPEVLGKFIGAALVGTFLGILMSYGFVTPMGNALGKFYGDQEAYLKVIKSGILAYMQGHAPAVAVEFARKSIPPQMMPDFQELEEATQKV